MKSVLKLKKSILYSWLVSYMFILFIPILLSAIVYAQSVRVVQHQILDLNRAMITQFQQVVDGQMQNIRQISLQMAVNPDLQAFLAIHADGQPALSFDYANTLKMLLQELNLYTLSNSFIPDFYVYLPESGVVLTSNGYYDSRTFYDTYMMTRSDERFEAWEEGMQRQYYGSFLLMPAEPRDGGESLITLVRSLPTRGERPRATLGLFIDHGALRDLLRGVEWSADSDVFIMNEEDDIMFATMDRSVRPNFIRYDALPDSAGTLYGEWDGVKTAASYTASVSGEWKYVSLSAMSLFNEKVAYIRKLTLYCLLFCTVLGGVLAYLFARRNYNPLQELVSRIVPRVGLGLDGAPNEYSLLGLALDKAITGKEAADRELEQQQTAMRAHFLARLLKGRAGRLATVAESADRYEMALHGPRYAVVLLYIEDCSRLTEGMRATEESAPDQLRLAHFIVQNVGEEWLSRRYPAYAAEVDDLLACIVNLDEQPEETLHAELEHSLTELLELLRVKFKLDCTVSVSRVFGALPVAHEAYGQALEALEYKLVYGKGSVLRYDTLSGAFSEEGDYHYSLETEQMLTNSLKSGDYDQARAILDRIFAANFAHGVTSVQLARCLMFDLVSTMIKTMNEIRAFCEPRFLESLRPTERLLACRTVEEMREELTDIVSRVCAYIAERNKGLGQSRLRESLLRFITDRHADPNLDLTMIAKHVGLSPKYVSAFFKQTIGEGVTGYITKLRLSEAKSQLTSTGLTIAEVAERVGFSNSSGLIRAFNKYEGITPGQYREIAASTEKNNPQPEK
ncbi:helix-turn-helix domain-containing protein [Paenibacillus sp. IB182496]|uniref:Helix-turn-helix domain-containing protein n=1 Tax=Paenibacillus sabuli TaxID=2772509 RepID=A0A927BSN6_9BACL|nr:helix-turn-helix domain-containing protein [Paenibacillus sabuli]MBD2845045.1 helix-turn-helix domain-containing protein [Paenibacillus sabuli]